MRSATRSWRPWRGGAGRIFATSIFSAAWGARNLPILLPETDLFTASEIAERIRRSVANEIFATSQGPVNITVSLGVSKAVPSLRVLDELINQADTALYKAKQNGRNRVEIG